MPTSCGGLLSSITLCVGPDMAFTPLDNDDPSKAIQLATPQRTNMINDCIYDQSSYL